MKRLPRIILILTFAVFSGTGHAADMQDAKAPEEIIPFQGRVWGGIPVNITDYPWQAALKIQKDNKTYICGGVIITQTWVLTAAHCLDGTQKAAVTVKTGEEYYESNSQWDAVDRLIISEEYNSSTHENDIALIKLSVPPKGRAIPMAGASLTLPIGTVLEVTGWGVTEKGTISKELRMAQVPLVDNATCNAPGSYNGGIKPGMMCAGRKEGGIDSCQGDSGGPLISRSQNGPVLIGIVSFGEGCAKKLKFGVYTHVSAYRAWIASTMAAN